MEAFTILGTCSFICQGTSTRKQRSGHFGLRVKLPSLTTCLKVKAGISREQLIKISMYPRNPG